MTTIYFDLETGGVNTEPSIQLAAIAVRDLDGTELAAFEQKIQFDPAKCSPEALAMNHYTPEAWMGAVPPQEAASRFMHFAEPYKCIEMLSKRTGDPYRVGKLAGYNALTFDYPRLRAMFGTAFFPFSYHVRDILQRAIFWCEENDKRPENLRLGTMCAYFGIPTDGQHEALTDVRLTAALYRKLAGK